MIAPAHDNSLPAGTPQASAADFASDFDAEIPDAEAGGSTAKGANVATTVMEDLRDLAAAFHRWPREVQFTLLALLAVYVPVIVEVSQIWRKDDTYAHGFLIIPICLFIIWLNRDDVRRAAVRPTVWGLPLIALGLFLETAGYLLQVKLVAMFSLIPTIIGVVLALHGPELWRQLRFPIAFLFFAVPLPDFIFGPASRFVQSASSTGAATLMSALGFTVLQNGNLIEIPGMTLEVAEVCSGFRKLIALGAFSLLYGYLFDIAPWKRAVLFLAAFPIALMANVIRISALIAVSSMWGEKALHIAHDWAEVFVLVIAFALYLLLGKGIGCKNLRF